MDDDVQRAQGAIWSSDEAGEPDAIGDAEAIRQLLELVARPLAPVGVVDRVADDVRTNRDAGRNSSDGIQEDGVALPTGERPEQTDSNRLRGCR